jgi:DNA-binding NarL/FixJ family response regulator
MAISGELADSSSAIGEGIALSVKQIQVLRLLAGGDTDEVVARKLGMSVRSERRLVSEVMDASNDWRFTVPGEQSISDAVSATDKSSQ